MELPKGTITLTLGKVTKYTEGKDGKPYKDKNGRPFARASVRFIEMGEDYFGGFWNDKLEEGAKVDVEVYEEVYEGKTYKKFRVAKKEDKLALELSEIKTKLGKMNFDIQTILKHLSGESPLNLTSAGTKIPDFSEIDDIPPEDVPFP